jgi:hypothetical protein
MDWSRFKDWHMDEGGTPENPLLIPIHYILMTLLICMMFVAACIGGILYKVRK